MTVPISAAWPQIPKIERDNIPSLLKGIDQWVIWRAGPLKGNGKFDKIPISPSTGHNINGQDPKNWLPYKDAVAAYDRGIGNGIGIVLNNEHTIQHNGSEYYLIALDFDNCFGSLNSFNELWLSLGKPYVERSPSGNGLRMFALSTEVLRGGNDGNGHELYSGGRFMTVTGGEGRGQVKDATAGLVDLHQQWFGQEGPREKSDPGSNLSPELLAKPGSNTWLPREQTDQEVERVKQQLSFVSSDTDYETWRNIVWAIMSTGWTSAEAIAREWSMKAADRYDASAFDNLVRSFDPSRGITLGTLYHRAEQNGWKPAALQPNVGDSAVKPHRLLTAQEVKALPNLPYRVRGLLPAQGVAAIYGEPGSGKSFLAMDLCFSIAAGRADWFGMAVHAAPVAYIALEGRGGVSKRIKAWEKHNRQPVSGQVRFLLGDFTLMGADVENLGADIVASLGPGAIVVVDTLNQSAPGVDENASKDMGLVLGNAQKLAKLVHGLVILVHHAGKDRARGMRGHSSLLAAMDAVIEVYTSSDGRSWKVAKSKDDEGGLSYDFELVRVVVDADADGSDITSCAVHRTVNAPVVKAKPLSGKQQIAAMAGLQSVLTANPAGISHADAIKEVATVLTCPQGRKATVAKETIDRLILNGHLVFSNGAVRLPCQPPKIAGDDGLGQTWVASGREPAVANPNQPVKIVHEPRGAPAVGSE
jgi:AAA domain/Primase C terminal 2 (PriCT-2)